MCVKDGDNLQNTSKSDEKLTKMAYKVTLEWSSHDVRQWDQKHHIPNLLCKEYNYSEQGYVPRFLKSNYISCSVCSSPEWYKGH